MWKIVAFMFVEFAGMLNLAATAYQRWEYPGDSEFGPGIFALLGPCLIMGGLIAWLRNRPTEEAARQKHRQTLAITLIVAAVLAGTAFVTFLQYIDKHWPGDRSHHLVF